MRITYTGMAPGQSETIICAGARWTRGETKNISDEAVATALIRKGGFETVRGGGTRNGKRRAGK